MLYIVSLPIGNSKDITYRAIEVLKSVDLILCEDSRQFKKHQRYYDIKIKIDIYEDFNERSKCEKIINMLKMNKKIALVSDGGTPMISDPGYHILQACYNNNIKVSTIPGCSAVTSAVSLCPFNNGEFHFCGFYDKKKHFTLIEYSMVDLVFFESPKRILNTLENIFTILDNDRSIFIAKEMTKEFENFYIIKDVKELKNIIAMGEFVFIVSKKNKIEEKHINYDEILELFHNLHIKDLAKIINYFKKIPVKNAYSNLITTKCDKINK